MMPVMLILFIFHVKYYKKAFNLLKNRRLNIEGLEPKFSNYGRKGCTGYIREVYTRFGDSNLTKNEKKYLKRSYMIRRYWWSFGMFVSLLFTSIDVLFWNEWLASW